MKGLLVKDWRLFLQRKNFFVLLAVIAAIFGYTSENMMFTVSYFTIIVSVFSTSTITYDEYDNCYPFLFTMPVTRRVYAYEKFVFGILSGLGALLLSTAMVIIISLIKGDFSASDIFYTAFMIIPVFLIINSVALPFNMKFGVEKGRTAVVVFAGALFVVVLILRGLFPDLMTTVADKLDEADKNITVAIPVTALIISSVITAVSCRISTGIMEKKEI